MTDENPFPEPVEIPITDSLDLHSFSPKDIRAVVEAYLAAAHEKGFEIVRIIHGKGLRSKAGGPVLKGLTDRLLRRRDDVVAFASARPMQGGTGAVVVLLKA